MKQHSPDFLFDEFDYNRCAIRDIRGILSIKRVKFILVMGYKVG
jgi:hypothetical protein